MRRRAPLWILCACLSLGLVACGSDEDPEPGADAGTDTGAGDGGGDDGGGADADAGEDTAPDTTPDIGEDTTPDVDEDTTPDTGEDTEPDVGDDTTPDTAEDTAPDTVEDTAPDTAPDGGGDVACVDPCTLDETRCAGIAIETCVEVDGCPVFQESDVCGSGVCLDGACQDPTCADGVRNGAEVDIDCGGPDCDGCSAGQMCAVSDDCAGDLVCGEFMDGFECVAVNCDDGERNGDETGIDCGGSCPGCDGGEPCFEAGDCASGVCAGGFCGFPSCEDGIRNGDETGVDCGDGIDDCPLCAEGEGCASGADCISGVCGEDTLCAAPSCTDGLLNGSETDADCGGPDCDGCPTDATCATNSDCDSGVCDDVNCAAPACDDGVQNGDETGVDCGGATCDACPPPTLEDVSAAIFDVHCIVCHTPGGAGPFSLELDAGLLGRLTADSSAGMPYITPGDVANSYLWHKVNGTQSTVGGFGLQMPRGREPLNDEELALLRAWIEGGALE